MEAATIVENNFGKGKAIYAAADLESGDATVNQRSFVALIRRLLGRSPRFEVNTHPAVWVTAFDQPEHQRTLISFLNYQDALPVLPISEVPFLVRPPLGKNIQRISLLPSEETIPIVHAGDGAVNGILHNLHLFHMISVEWSD